MVVVVPVVGVGDDDCNYVNFFYCHDSSQVGLGDCNYRNWLAVI